MGHRLRFRARSHRLLSFQPRDSGDPRRAAKLAPTIPQGTYETRSTTANQSGAGIDITFTIPPSKKQPPTIAPRTNGDRLAISAATRPPANAPPAWATRTIRNAGSGNDWTYALIAAA